MVRLSCVRDAGPVQDIRRDTNAERMRLKLALAETIVLDTTLGKLEQRVVLRMLSAYLNFRTLRMWPGVERLAAELQSDKRHVKRALSRLCTQEGYLVKVHGTGRGPGNPTMYEARWDRAFEGARVAKERVREREKGAKNDTKGAETAPLKGGAPGTLSLIEETFDKPCLLDTPSRGREGSGERGGELGPLDDEPANDIHNAEVARQDDQAGGPLPPGSQPRQGTQQPKPRRWRAAKARPLGPCERAVQRQRTKDQAHEGNQGNDVPASKGDAQDAPPGGAAQEDGGRTGCDSSRPGARGQD